MANEPPIGSLFSAFLGYNPVQQLLGPTGALAKLSPSQAAYITGRSFFPKLIEAPFADGLHLAFTFALIATLVAVVASALRGGRYMHRTEPLAEELAEGAAESGGLLGLEPVATDGQEAPFTVGQEAAVNGGPVSGPAGNGGPAGSGAGNGRPSANGHAASGAAAGAAVSDAGEEPGSPVTGG